MSFVVGRLRTCGCGQEPSSPSMPAFLRALATQLGDDRPELGRVVDRVDARAAVPALGDGQHVARRLEHAAGDALRLGRGEPGDDRRDPARRARSRSSSVSGAPPRPSVMRVSATGADGVDRDAVAGQLERGDVRERGDADLRRAVVRLAGVAVDARHRRGVDDPAVDLLARLRPARASRPRPSGPGAKVPLRWTLMTASHSSSVMLVEHPVAQDAGVVDDDVEVAEGLDRRVDQPLGALPRRDVVAVGDRLAAHRLDLRRPPAGPG